MKKTIVIMGATALSLLALSVHAQQTWDPQKNPTVTAITSKYADKYITTKTELTTAEIYPVTGTFSSATNPEAGTVTISLDEANKGVIWVEGLPQGKLKAMLRKLPDTYKIPVQKTAEGKEVAEGTLIYDNDTRTLSICIGKSYNNADPVSVFALPAEQTAVTTAKTKTIIKKATVPKAWIYTGTKALVETAAAK